MILIHLHVLCLFTCLCHREARLALRHMRKCTYLEVISICKLEVFQEHIPRTQDSIAAMASEVGTECGCAQTSVYAHLSYDVMALQRATVCEELGWL